MKTVITQKDLHSLSQLMSLNEEDFIKHFDGKDLGYVMSMKNFTSIMFNDAQKTKNDLVNLFPKVSGEKKQKFKDVLDNLYNVLQNLENKFYLLKFLEDSRRNSFQFDGEKK